MKIKNTTNIPTWFLREVINFSCPPGVTKYSVWFKNADKYNKANKDCFCGRYYGYRKYIVCRVSSYRILTKQYKTTAYKGYLPWRANTWEEACVALMAHEFRHAWQSKHSSGRVWGAKGRQSERECDAYAIRTMRKWRREKPLRLLASK